MEATLWAHRLHSHSNTSLWPLTTEEAKHSGHALPARRHSSALRPITIASHNDLVLYTRRGFAQTAHFTVANRNIWVPDCCVSLQWSVLDLVNKGRPYSFRNMGFIMPSPGKMIVQSQCHANAPLRYITKLRGIHNIKLSSKTWWQAKFQIRM